MTVRKFVIVFISFYLTGCAAVVSRDTRREFNLGKEAVNQERYDDAINYFMEHLKKNPRDADAHLRLGGAFLKKESLKEAINEFKQAITLDQENEEAKNFVKKSIFDEALKFSREGKEDASMRYMTGYLTIDPDDIDAYLYLGRAFIKKGDQKNALWCLNKLVSLAPRNPEVIELMDYFSP